MLGFDLVQRGGSFGGGGRRPAEALLGRPFRLLRFRALETARGAGNGFVGTLLGALGPAQGARQLLQCGGLGLLELHGLVGAGGGQLGRHLLVERVRAQGFELGLARRPRREIRLERARLRVDAAVRLVGDGCRGRRSSGDTGGNGRLEQQRVRDLDRRRVVAGDDDTRAELGKREDLLRVAARQTHAAVGRRIARQCAAMERDARPRQTLHERHLGVVVEIRIVIAVLLQDGIDADRRLIVRPSAGHARAHGTAFGVVHRDALMAQRDDGEHGRADRFGSGRTRGRRLQVASCALLGFGRHRKGEGQGQSHGGGDTRDGGRFQPIF